MVLLKNVDLGGWITRSTVKANLIFKCSGNKRVFYNGAQNNGHNHALDCREAIKPRHISYIYLPFYTFSGKVRFYGTQLRRTFGSLKM